MARNTRTFTDLNLLFTINPATADITKRVDVEAIKASVRNLLQTKNYERPFHPEIGCQIHSLLFENYLPTTRYLMKKTITDVIDKFEPRVTLLNVDIRDLPDNNEVEVTVEFRINNIEIPVVLTTTLSRVR